MKKFIETSNLLKSIKAEDLETVYWRITDKAAEWAVGGYLDYANQLLQDIWAFHSSDTGNVRRQLEGLQIMWELSGNKPPSIPFAFRNVEEVEEENWGYLALGRGGRFEGKNITTILGQLESEIQQSSDYNSCKLSAGAAILALDNGLIPEAEKFIHFWGIEYMKDASCTVGELTRNRKVAAILLQGKLSSVLELTEERCSAEYKDLSAALKKRKESGRTLIYGDQSWVSLLRKISLLSIEQNAGLHSDDIILSKWLGNDPASEEELLITERKIGRPLPGDYREFLKASNGFLAHSYISPSLARVQEIG